MKLLKESELKDVVGGSSNLFWTRYGVGAGAGAKCALRYGALLQGATTVVCGARAAYAAIKG